MSTLFEPIRPAQLAWHDGVPYALDFSDVYYSIENGLEESRHVFINGNHLIERWQALPTDRPVQFVIAETGFGAGINFLLTWSLWQCYAPKNAKLHYVTCEKHPLRADDLAQCLALWPQLAPYAQTLLAAYPTLTPGYHVLDFVADRVCLTLMLGDATDCYHQLLLSGDDDLEPKIRDVCVDAWFLDGFSPQKNPAMWQEPLLKILALLSKPTTTLATYSVAGSVRQALSRAGFSVQKQIGYGRKREMLAAEYTASRPNLRGFRTTPWHVAVPRCYTTRHAIVIGAGLAGCYVAHALAQRGWRVTLIDRQGVAAGASGISRAVLYPKLSAFRSPLTEFMLSAYLYASTAYQALLAEHAIGEISGILQVAHHAKEIAAQQSLRYWLTCYPELGQLLTAEQSSVLAGVTLKSGGLYLPKSGWIDSQALCHRLIQHSNIVLKPNCHIQSLQQTMTGWRVDSEVAEVVVLANGQGVLAFNETNHLPLKPLRGQMTSVAANAWSTQLNIPLCAEAHVLPAAEGAHWLGATYDPLQIDAGCLASDDAMNLASLQSMPVVADWSETVLGHWSGIRVATPDYLPLVGLVPNAAEFQQQFAGLATNSKRWIPTVGAYYPGLYVCAGFGSRGLTTIPLSAHWLAAKINGEPDCLPQHLVKALSPARFLRRKLYRSG